MMYGKGRACPLKMRLTAFFCSSLRPLLNHLNLTSLRNFVVGQSLMNGVRKLCARLLTCLPPLLDGGLLNPLPSCSFFVLKSPISVESSDVCVY